jgi:hypothetical protein
MFCQAEGPVQCVGDWRKVDTVSGLAPGENLHHPQLISVTAELLVVAPLIGGIVVSPFTSCADA